MRVWFMMAALTLGLMGWFGLGQSDQNARGGQVSTLDGPGPIPTPKAP